MTDKLPEDLSKADFYWNFKKQKNDRSFDDVHKRPAVLTDGAEIDTNAEGENVATTSSGGAHGWISLGDFAGKIWYMIQGYPYTLYIDLTQENVRFSGAADLFRVHYKVVVL